MTLCKKQMFQPCSGTKKYCIRQLFPDAAFLHFKGGTQKRHSHPHRGALSLRQANTFILLHLKSKPISGWNTPPILKQEKCASSTRSLRLCFTFPPLLIPVRECQPSLHSAVADEQLGATYEAIHSVGGRLAVLLLLVAVHRGDGSFHLDWWNYAETIDLFLLSGV